jgi:hypothetical protein
MILNLQVRKDGDTYSLLQQSTSDHIDTGSGVEDRRAPDTPVFQGSRDAVENWLADRGIPQSDVAYALDEAGHDSGPLLEVDADYSESENFPKL